MQIYAGTHYVFLNIQFRLSFPLISPFPPETAILLCFGHFYYKHCAYLWPTLLHFAPRVITTFFSKLINFLSIICNAKILFHGFAANSAFIFFLRYLLPFLNCVGHTLNLSVWCKKNPNFVSKNVSVV